MVAGGDCTVVGASPCRTFCSRLQTTLKQAQKRRGLCERTARQLSEHYLIIKYCYRPIYPTTDSSQTFLLPSLAQVPTAAHSSLCMCSDDLRRSVKSIGSSRHAPDTSGRVLTSKRTTYLQVLRCYASHAPTTTAPRVRTNSSN